MTWRDLSSDVAALFGELSGEDRAADALHVARARVRSRDVKRNADWRRRNPAKRAELNRAYRRRWRKRNREKWNAQKRAAYAQKKLGTKLAGDARRVPGPGASGRTARAISS